MKSFKEKLSFLPKIPSKTKGAIPNEFSNDLLYVSHEEGGLGNLEYALLYDSNNIVQFDIDYKLFVESMINAAYAWQKLERTEIFGPINKPIVKFSQDVNYFDIPIPSIEENNNHEKHSAFISYLNAGGDLTIEFTNLPKKFTINPEDDFFVYNSLCAIISYADKLKLEFHKDIQTEEIKYIYPPGRLMDFVFNARKELYLIDKKWENDANNVLQNSVLEGLVEHDFLWEKDEFEIRTTKVIYSRYNGEIERHIIYNEEFETQEWDVRLFDLIHDKNSLSGKVPSILDLQTSINYFIEKSKLDYIFDLFPEAIIDFDNRELIIMYSFDIDHLKHVPLGWKVKWDNILNLIPEKEHYWIIDGKNYLEEIYGNVLKL